MRYRFGPRTTMIVLMTMTLGACLDTSAVPPCSGEPSEAWQRSPAAALVPSGAVSCAGTAQYKGGVLRHDDVESRTAFLVEGRGQEVIVRLIQRANADGWERFNDNLSGAQKVPSSAWTRLRRARGGQDEWLRIEVSDLAARQRGPVLDPKSYVVMSYKLESEDDRASRGRAKP